MKLIPKSLDDFKQSVVTNNRTKETLSLLIQSVIGWGCKIAVFDDSGNHDIYFLKSDTSLSPSDLVNCRL